MCSNVSSHVVSPYTTLGNVQFEASAPHGGRKEACIGSLSAMGKNVKGGKNKRRGKNDNSDEKRELTIKEEGQEYATVIKMLGAGRVSAQCFDGKMRLGNIRGKMRKRVWINVGDTVLVALRDFQDDKVDIIQKYSPDEARQLKAMGELPEAAKINDVTATLGSDEEEEDDTFIFEKI